MAANLFDDLRPAGVFKISEAEFLVELAVVRRAEIRAEDDALAAPYVRKPLELIAGGPDF